MKEFKVSIDPSLLFQLLEQTFKKLPPEHYKLFQKLPDIKSRSFFRDTLISKYIGIPTSRTPIFKQFAVAHAFSDIYIETVDNSLTELQVHVNDHGIIGISINENLEDLLLATINTESFQLAPVTLSKFYYGDVDLEGLEAFEEIGDYFSDFSVDYLIEGKHYYNLIDISDEKCIAIDEKNAVFLVNKMTGFVKLLHERPQKFIEDFKAGRLSWVFENA